MVVVTAGAAQAATVAKAVEAAEVSESEPDGATMTD